MRPSASHLVSFLNTISLRSLSSFLPAPFFPASGGACRRVTLVLVSDCRAGCDRRVRLVDWSWLLAGCAEGLVCGFGSMGLCPEILQDRL
jgi:hypothetical protein